jgi:hypothetical protein
MKNSINNTIKTYCKKNQVSISSLARKIKLYPYLYLRPPQPFRYVCLHPFSYLPSLKTQLLPVPLGRQNNSYQRRSNCTAQRNFPAKSRNLPPHHRKRSAPQTHLPHLTFLSPFTYQLVNSACPAIAESTR